LDRENIFILGEILLGTTVAKVKVKLKVKYRPRRPRMGEEIQLYSLPAVKRPGSSCIEGWVGPRFGLDACGKSRPPSGFDLQIVRKPPPLEI